MTATSGDRLPYLLAKLKAPQVRDRLEQTAERARAEGGTDEHSLEALLKAEVFARRCGDGIARTR